MKKIRRFRFSKQSIEVFGASGVGKSHFISRVMCNSSKFKSLNHDFAKEVKGNTIIEKLDLLLFRLSGKSPDIFMRAQWIDFIMKNQKYLNGFWFFLNNRSSISFHGSEFILSYHFLYSFARMNILNNWKSNKILVLDEGLIQRLLGLKSVLLNEDIKLYIETYLKLSQIRKFIYCHADLNLILERVMKRKIHGIHLGKNKKEIKNIINCDALNSLRVANFLNEIPGIKVITIDIGQNVKEIKKILNEVT